MSVSPTHYFEFDGTSCAFFPETLDVRVVPIGSTDHRTHETISDLTNFTDETVGARKPAGTEPLSSIVLLVTQTCNLRCTYCYAHGDGTYGTTGNLTPAMAEMAVDWLIAQSSTLKTLSISFFGGEPTIRFDIVEHTINYSKEKCRESGKEFTYSIITNGTILTDEMIEYLHDNNVYTVVSLDGDKERHDRQRPFAGGRGSYDVTVRNIRKLLQKMPHSPGRATLTGEIDPEQARKSLIDLGFSSVMAWPASDSLFDSGQKAGAGRNMTKVLESIDSEGREWIGAIKGRKLNELRRLRSVGTMSSAITVLNTRIRKRYACNAGVSTVGVASDGGVYLCHRFVGQEEYKLGDVGTYNIDREKFTSFDAQKIEPCASCFANSTCAGGCKHDNASATGSPFVPAPDMCNVARRTHEIACWIVGQLSTDDKYYLSTHDIIPQRPCPLDFV